MPSEFWNFVVKNLANKPAVLALKAAACIKIAFTVREYDVAADLKFATFLFGK